MVRARTCGLIPSFSFIISCVSFIDCLVMSTSSNIKDKLPLFEVLVLVMENFIPLSTPSIVTVADFEASLITSTTLESCNGLGSTEPVNAHSIDIANDVLPLPLLSDPPSLLDPRSRTSPRLNKGYVTGSWNGPKPLNDTEYN